MALADEESAVAPYIQPGTREYQALQRWAANRGSGEVKSEASALRALLAAGAEALRDDVLDAGYAELATIYSGVDQRDERRIARDRYAARTDSNIQ